MIAWDIVAALPDLVHAVGHAASVLHASDYDSDEGSSGWLLLSGPAAGTAVYWALFRYYRNTDKSHQFERETLIEAQPVTGAEAKVGEVKGKRSSSIEGANGKHYRQRVKRVQ